jgi:hypothetical protein
MSKLATKWHRYRRFPRHWRSNCEASGRPWSERGHYICEGTPARLLLWIPVSSLVSSCLLTGGQSASLIESRCVEAVRLGRSQAGFFKRSATVFKISCESASSDTARASDIAPTSALKVKIALDLASRLSLPGSNSIINSTSFLTCSEVSARVRLPLRAISGASALKAQPVPGFLRCTSLK